MRDQRRSPRQFLSPVLTIAALFVARASLADHYRVPTGSMEPTVEVGDHVCVNKLAYGLRIPATQTYLLRGRAPERGDVAVLNSPADGEVLLKRIVGLPGDTVEVHYGHVVINGAEVPTRASGADVFEELGTHVHPLSTTSGGGPDLRPTRVPNDRYLVLGDNRGNSLDGRYFGWVTRDALLGRASAVCARDGWPVWRPL
jgi:signal peptidase I